jgi:hypothetical protein
MVATHLNIQLHNRDSGTKAPLLASYGDLPLSYHKALINVSTLKFPMMDIVRYDFLILDLEIEYGRVWQSACWRDMYTTKP